MKKVILPLFFLMSIVCYAQGPMSYLQHPCLPGDTEVVGGTHAYRDALIGTYSYTDSEKLKILEKQYLTSQYLIAKVDNYSAQAYLRYNMFSDQMEFSKDGIIYYLKKEDGRVVNFKNLNTKYKVYDVNENLEFLKVEAEGEYSLMTKQSKKFLAPKNRRSNSAYQTHLKASFKRNKDVLYMELSSGKIVEVPSKKAEFFDLFGEDTMALKTYMDENKIGFKKVEDLKKVVHFLNSWSDDIEKG